MTGAIVVTHGTLANELNRSAQMIIGSHDGLYSYSIEQGSSPSLVEQHISTMVQDILEKNDSILFLTDMFGGTPTNICSLFAEPGKVELISGVNLPMIIKFATLRKTLQLDELVTRLTEYGKNGIIIPSRL